MHAIILVGGRGTRLQPLTDTRPKPMLPIVDAPFLTHQLLHLKRHGITHVTFACGFLPNEIIGYFGEGESVGLHLNYVVEPTPLDTGGAIGFAARAIGPERLLVCNGDILTGLDVGALLRTHGKSGAEGTIHLTPVEDPSRYGLVRTDAEGRVLAFLEKPEPSEVDTNLINAGTYVLEPAAIDRIPTEGRCNIEREVFPAMAADEVLHAFPSDDYWRDIGTFESYLAANADVLEGRIAGIDGRARNWGVALAEGAQVSPDATLHAPTWIGPGVTIAGGANVGPDAVICAGASVAEGARVARGVVLERAHVGREAQVVDAIVGEDATVGERASLSDGAVLGPGAVSEAPILRGT